MPVKVHLRHLRISPRKVRLVVDLIRGLGVEQAEAQLEYMPKKAAQSILKLLRSAVAAADHDFKMEKKNLYISKAYVDVGPTLKRFMPRAMGRAAAIHKRISHITLELDNNIEDKSKKIVEAAEDATKKITVKKNNNNKKKEVLKSK